MLHIQCDGIDLAPVFLPDMVKALIDRLEGLRLELLESQHLHFAHVFVHADPLCQRGIDIHRFARDALALLGVLDEIQRAHIVQAVTKLDQQHANILAHGEKELAQVFRRAFVLGHLLDLGELGHAVHQTRNIASKVLFDILDRRKSIFDGIVQQGGSDGFLIEFQVSHQSGDFDRVAEIGIPARPGLSAVFLHRINVGAVKHGLVGVRVVFLDPLYKFVLAQHA